jgi:SAM-dependent methyltransferase
VNSRWSSTSGDAYDARWKQMAAKGQSIHGEADFVCRFDPGSVLDAGCGTGRVGIELARRGIEVVGVDLDEAMLTAARAKAPDLAWITADLRDVDLGRAFDVVVMPGNVMIFLAPGTEREVIDNMARHVSPGGRLIAGFQLRRGYELSHYDADCAAAGLELDARYSTWEGAPWKSGGDYSGGDYAVSVHRQANVDTVS